MIQQNLKTIFNTKIINNKNNELDNGFNNEAYDYKTKIKKLFSSNSSFDKSKKIKINKNLNNNKINNLEQNEQNINNQKERIDGKSIFLLKDRTNLKSQDIIYKYKSKEKYHNIQSKKTLTPQTNNNKSQTQKEIEYINTDENPNNTKTKQKIKINYDLINKIHQNKFLDLYSFSISPPDGKINLDYLTINENLPKKTIQKKKILDMEKENGVNFKIIEMRMDFNKNTKKRNISSQSSIQNDRKKLWIMKNKDKTGLSTGRTKVKKKYSDLPINKNAIITIPKNFILPFNKTFIENDYNKKNNINNDDNFKIRNTMKELKIKDNIHCLTGK